MSTDNHLQHAVIEELSWEPSVVSAHIEAWFEAGLHVELGEAGLTFPGWTMAP